MTKLRSVYCYNCGHDEPVVAERSDFVQLPPGWRRIGMDQRNGGAIFYCDLCYQAEILKAARNRD
jgi:hypothetical protein